jgi:hypothetical protein
MPDGFDPDVEFANELGVSYAKGRGGDIHIKRDRAKRSFILVTETEDGVGRARRLEIKRMKYRGDIVFADPTRRGNFHELSLGWDIVKSRWMAGAFWREQGRGEASKHL